MKPEHSADCVADEPPVGGDDMCGPKWQYVTVCRWLLQEARDVIDGEKVLPQAALLALVEFLDEALTVGSPVTEVERGD